MTSAAPISGTSVDGFLVGECVHQGAMGRLFEVTRPAAPFPMLMKIPRLGEGDPAELLLGFEAESMILPRLAGAHVPRFVAAGDVTTIPYVVTERVPGASLDLRPAGPAAIEEVARIGAAIADALHDIHAQDAIHLDLKPDNVILHPDGHAVLVDFALAHHRDLPDLLAEEQRFMAGSAPYVSPEQVRGDRSDPRSDLFALGVILYELSTGKLPFGAPATLAGQRDRLWREPVPPAILASAVPPWLQEIVLRCLEVDPARRYQSAAHVAFDLNHPAQVALTERAHRDSSPRVLAQAARWWRAREGSMRRASLRHDAPVIMVAVDTTHPDDLRQPELQRSVRRILSLSAEYRLICVSVIPAGPEIAATHAGGDQLQHRVRLRHWINPLGIEPHRVSLHVIEAADAGSALVEFARANNVDLIVLGAPAPDERALAWWRSAASSVTANAACSVHVVRRPRTGTSDTATASQNAARTRE